MFDTAILTARQLKVDMTGIFERLAIKCIDAAHSAAHSRSLGIECVFSYSFGVRTCFIETHTDLNNRASSFHSEDLNDSQWLLSSPIVSSLDGPISARAEQYLKIMLTRHDDESTFYRYREVVLEKLLEHDRRLPLPSWLVDFFAVSIFPLRPIAVTTGCD